MESGNGFVIQVKGNRQWLLRGIRRLVEESSSLSIYKTVDKNKGRIDERIYEVYDMQEAKIPKGYEDVSRVIRVTRSGIRNHKHYTNTAYYISDQLMNAERISKGIRGHWSIENLLHRTKDVVQNEDKNMIKNKKLSANVSIIQTLAINILRVSGYKSILKANELFANKLVKSINLINST